MKRSGPVHRVTRLEAIPEQQGIVGSELIASGVVFGTVGSLVTIDVVVDAGQIDTGGEVDGVGVRM